MWALNSLHHLCSLKGILLCETINTGVYMALFSCTSNMLSSVYRNQDLCIASGRLILLMNIKHKPFTCCFILGYASSLKSQPLTKIKEEEIWELTYPKMVLENLPIFHQHQTNIYQKLYHRTFSLNISLEADFISLRYDCQNSPASSFFMILFSSNTAK